MERIKKKHAQKIRYGLVGILNTGLDFLLLFTFVFLGLNKIPANYLSTGICMVISFFANKKFTFKNTNEQKKRQFVLFVSVTILGMWVIQPVVIWTVVHLGGTIVTQEQALLFVAKLIATGASLISNYVLYSRVVFKKHHNQDVTEIF